MVAEAAHLLGRAAAQNPQDRGLPARQARELFAAGEIDDGCQAAARAGAAEGSAAVEILLAQAGCARARGNAADAREFLEQALKVSPQDADVQRALAAVR